MTTAETIRIEIPIETIDKTDPALSNVTKKMDKLGDAADKAGQSVDSTRRYVTKFDEQADKTQKSLAKWAKEKYEITLEAKDRIAPVLQTLGGNLKSLTSKTWGFTLKAVDLATAPVRAVLNLLKNPLLQAGAFFGVSFGLTDTINTQKDFESAMSQVQAVSGATGDELGQLTKKAEQMGATTKFTATESAEAFNYMAMAGWKTEDMMDGIEGILNLAAASNEDLGTTSDIVTDALTAFGLKASDAGMFSDVLAAASSNANTNVSMMGETFKYAASMAGSLGYSIQDVALMTGLMANSGIKASMAGTSLNMIMTRLSTNTGHALDKLQSLGIQFFDTAGNARPLADVIEELRDATAKMNDEQKSSVANTIAGSGAQKGLLAILNASEEDYTKLANAIDNASGASERMADTQLDNLGGSITLLQSAVDGVKISFGKRLNPYVKDIADGLTASMPDIESALNDFMDFVDRKYDRLQAKIKEVTATEEWQNADFGGRFKIVWDDIIATPFKEWWGTTGKEMLSGIASDVGQNIGSGISSGLLMLLGIDVSDSVNEGASVGKAFATGFSEGFDFDTIKQNLFAGLGNMLSSAGKLLPGGKSADLGSVVSAAIIAKMAVPAVSFGSGALKIGKGVFGAQKSLDGASLAGTIIGSASADTGLIGLGQNTAIALGAGNLSATASLGAGTLGALGLGSIAGGAVGGASAISGAIDLYKASRSSDEEYKNAYTTAGATKLTGVAGGAAAGAMIGSIIPGVGTVVGGLIGAGLGGMAGFAESKRVKKEYEESVTASTLVTEKMQKVYDITGYSVENVNFKTQALTSAMNDANVSAEEFGNMLQQAVSDDLIDHFGKLHLSLTEIKDAASMIVFDGMDGKFDAYTSQADKAESALTSLKSSLNDLDKENWKMSLGMTVSEADIKDYRTSVSTMVDSTEDYLQNKHYEANLALKLIMGDDFGTTSLDNAYSAMDEQLKTLKEKLNTAIDANIKLNGGTLKLDSDSEILSLQQQIQDITNQVSQAESDAKLDVIKTKYGGTSLDMESFSSLQTELGNYAQEWQEQMDNALMTSFENLRLQLNQGTISQGDYDQMFKSYQNSYKEQLDEMQSRIESVQLQSIADAYSEALDGILPQFEGTTAEKLQKAMSEALKVKPDAASWTNSDIVEWFDLDGMQTETQTALIELIHAVADSLPQTVTDSLSGLGKTAVDATDDELNAISNTTFTKTAMVKVTPYVSLTQGVTVPTTTASGGSYTSPVTGRTVTPYAAGNHSMSIGGHASGGMVSGRELSWVGEEGPEMIIPLVPGRRERAVELYQQAGEILGITAHANSGLVGGTHASHYNATENDFSFNTINRLVQRANDASMAFNSFTGGSSSIGAVSYSYTNPAIGINVAPYATGNHSVNNIVSIINDRKLSMAGNDNHEIVVPLSPEMNNRVSESNPRSTGVFSYVKDSHSSTVSGNSISSHDEIFSSSNALNKYLNWSTNSDTATYSDIVLANRTDFAISSNALKNTSSVQKFISKALSQYSNAMGFDSIEQLKYGGISAESKNEATNINYAVFDSPVVYPLIGDLSTRFNTSINNADVSIIPKTSPMYNPTTPHGNNHAIYDDMNTAGNRSMSIGGHASGGMVSGRELSWVGEEGPEMIIPLVPGRRERAVELYQQAGEILGITAHANGGLVGTLSGGFSTPSMRFSNDTLNYLTETVNAAPINSHAFSQDTTDTATTTSTQNASSSTQQTSIQPNVTVKVEVSPTFSISGSEASDEDVMAVIRRHMKEMADELGGEIATKLDEVFSNMPLKGVQV